MDKKQENKRYSEEYFEALSDLIEALNKLSVLAPKARAIGFAGLAEYFEMELDAESDRIRRR